jgi:selenocysteine lyase/cysteine desulfurase
VWVNKYRKQFSLDPQVAYLNHGSFGAVPNVVATAQREFQLLEESNPNLFFRTTLPKLHDEARAFVAEWLSTSPELFAFVPNASQGVITAKTLQTLGLRTKPMNLWMKATFNTKCKCKTHVLNHQDMNGLQAIQSSPIR